LARQDRKGLRVKQALQVLRDRQDPQVLKALKVIKESLVFREPQAQPDHKDLLD
jgi:predicted Zn-ribbon and HTH transcriptional regulator